MMATTREFLVMARHSLIPGWLAEVHPTLGTPYRVIIGYGLVKGELLYISFAHSSLCLQTSCAGYVYKLRCMLFVLKRQRCGFVVLCGYAIVCLQMACWSCLSGLLEC